MSNTESHGYTRTNWWGEDVDGTDNHPTSHAGHDAEPIPGYKKDRAKWKSHDILTDTATKICGAKKTEGEVVQLTEPDYYPPVRDRGRNTTGSRINPIDGYISGGVSTWVAFDELPANEFLDVVNDCIIWWNHVEEGGLSQSFKDKLYNYASVMKSRQKTEDQEILADLLYAVRYPKQADDHLDITPPDSESSSE